MSDSLVFALILIAAMTISVFLCEAVDAWERQKNLTEDPDE